MKVEDAILNRRNGRGPAVQLRYPQVFNSRSPVPLSVRGRHWFIRPVLGIKKYVAATPGRASQVQLIGAAGSQATGPAGPVATTPKRTPTTYLQDHANHYRRPPKF